MTVTSWRLLMSSRARFHPTLPAPTITTYMDLPGHSLEADLAAHRGLEQLDRGLRRAYRLQTLLGVPARPRGVEHAYHHALDLEAALRDLRDDKIRVVPVGGRDEGIRLLDTRRQQGVHLERGSLREAATALLPRRIGVAVEQRYCLGVLVEHGHLVPLQEHRVRNRRPHPATSDDQHKHAVLTLYGRTPSRVPSSPAGGAVRITLQGAFSIT